MKRVGIVALAVLFFGFGCARTPVLPNIPTASDVREQVNGIADAQEVLREQALLLVVVKTSGVDEGTLAQWEARSRAAADLIVAKRYEQAVRDLKALNDEMRAALE